MKLSTVSSLVLSILPLTCAIPAPQAATQGAADVTAAQKQFEALKQQALDATYKQLDEQEAALRKRGVAPVCTSKNLQIRKEFGSLSQSERKAYTDAILCLQKKPAKTPSSISAGAKSRWDDFVVTHIQQTLQIHYTGTFLGWHRYYLYTFEQALKTECGFKGTVPYWEWSKWADAPQNSPLFNGDAYSMGGNGEFIPGHAGPLLVPSFPGLGTTPIQLAAGLGGGCVKKGPFKDYVVNLGPVGLADGSIGPDGGLGHNPRCLKRDIGPGVATKYTNWTAVLTVMKQKQLEDFQYELQGRPGSGSIGPHGGGHYTVGGDPGGDFFVSPSEPAFYLHHGQVDRLWTYWQALDPAKRTYALSGTNTYLNVPPSANTTLEDTLTLSYAGGGTVKMKDVLSTTTGPFCYFYL